MFGWVVWHLTMLCSRPASGCRTTSGMTQAYWHGYNLS